MRTKAVKTLLPIAPNDAWDTLVAPEYPPLFSSLPEIHVARWVGNYLIAQPRIAGGISVNIARVFNRPHRVEIATQAGRVWISLFDTDPDGTVWTAWIEGNFDAPPPSGFSTESRDWLEYYEVQLTRWSEAFSSMGWLLTATIPDDMRWTLD
jgi:hypothetical protein